MKFGCCCNTISTRSARTRFEWATRMIEIGYDYIGFPLAQIMAFSDEKFDLILRENGSAWDKMQSPQQFFLGGASAYQKD